MRAKVTYEMTDLGEHFRPGMHTFTGVEALAFARIRYGLPRGDFDRSMDQGQLLKGGLATIRDKMGRPGFIERALDVFGRYTETNLGPVELYRLARTVTEVDPSLVRGAWRRALSGMPAPRAWCSWTRLPFAASLRMSATTRGPTTAADGTIGSAPAGFATGASSGNATTVAVVPSGGAAAGLLLGQWLAAQVAVLCLSSGVGRAAMTTVGSTTYPRQQTIGTPHWPSGSGSSGGGPSPPRWFRPSH